MTKEKTTKKKNEHERPQSYHILDYNIGKDTLTLPFCFEPKVGVGVSSGTKDDLGRDKEKYQ